MMGKMMKIILNKLRRDETGQAFILVLILLLVGGLMISPLLGFMSTGLIAGQANEERMVELYAADAGIEDALWKLMNNQVPAEEDQPYHLTVNGKDVEVTVSTDEDTATTLLINLDVLPDNPSSYNKAKPHAAWLVVYAPIESSTTPGTYDTYRITGFYSSTQKRDVIGTGYWIHRYTGDGSAWIPWDVTEDNNLVLDVNGDGDEVDQLDIDGDGTMDIDESGVITRPLVEGYNPVSFRTEQYPMGSKAVIWEWGPNQGPAFGQSAEGGADVYCRTQRFTLDPSITVTDGKFPPNVAWIDTKQECISISSTGRAIGVAPVMAIATDPATGKKTTVISYVYTESYPSGTAITTILTWNADIQ